VNLDVRYKKANYTGMWYYILYIIRYTYTYEIHDILFLLIYYFVSGILYL
jgi:hypothetical protein